MKTINIIRAVLLTVVWGFGVISSAGALAQPGTINVSGDSLKNAARNAHAQITHGAWQSSLSSRSFSNNAPADKIFVIEQVSVLAPVENSVNQSVHIDISANNAAATSFSSYFVPGTRVGTKSNDSSVALFVAASAVKMYVGPGEQWVVTVVREDSTEIDGNFNEIEMSISGYFIDP
jgi:hypothetical protein